MKSKLIPALFFFTLLIGVISCKHYPFLVTNDHLTGIDSTDTTGNPPPFVGIPCDPDSVYFDSQILPIFISNCAQSGCHNAASHKEGYTLTSYSTIMSHGISPFHPTSGNIMNSILDGEMPQGLPDLTTEQIALLELWIQQGCQNNHCDELCDTTNVTYSGTIAPMMATYCKGCHNSNTAGGGIRLDAYSYVSSLALSDSLYNSVTATGVPLMPKGGQALPNCKIDEIRIWVDAGAPNN